MTLQPNVTTFLNVGQLIDALSQCNREVPVVFFDSNKERAFCISFVRENDLGNNKLNTVYLKSHIPNLDTIAFRPATGEQILNAIGLAINLFTYWADLPTAKLNLQSISTW